MRSKFMAVASMYAAVRFAPSATSRVFRQWPTVVSHSKILSTASWIRRLTLEPHGFAVRAAIVERR